MYIQSRHPTDTNIWVLSREKNICDMWQAHYRHLLNSVETSKSKELVKQELKSITDSSIAFFPVDNF